MATISNPNFCQIVGYPENYVVASKAAQNDYIQFPDPMVLIEQVYTDAVGPIAFVVASITVASFDALVTSITYSAGTGIPRLEGDYFLKVENELIHVKADTGNTAATGTLTVVRGALGTTAVAHEGSATYTAYIQNSIKLTGSETGDVKILYRGVPAFRDGLNFSTASNRVWSATNPNRIYGSDYTTPV